MSNYIMQEYDDALSSILNEGFKIEGDRTGVGTICKFGISTKYDISERFPILTKRRIFYKSIFKEVLWYISGSSNINDLENMGSKIWSPWKNKEFTNKHNLPEGSGGYIYGFNLIHFGADIRNPEDKGFNQLDYVINTLRENPKSRQACFTFWRPDTNNQAILPACHAFYSFIVSPDENNEMKILNCHVFQRSADYPIGVGAGNITTAALFTYLIAQQLDMKPGMLYHSASHCHIYQNAVNSTKEYVERIETPDSPILKIRKKSSIYDYTIDDLMIFDYDPADQIKFNIAV